MAKFVGITIGDINGIGIDILIKSFRLNKINNFILFTNIKIIKNYIQDRNISINLNIIKSDNFDKNYVKDCLNIYSYKCSSLEDNTYKSLKYAYNYCIRKICIGIITLPLRKDLIKKKIDCKFIGHTEFFQKIDRKKYSNMILIHKKLIISPITTHVEVKKVSKIISDKNYLYNQIKNLHNTLIHDLNIKRPKIAISGLNPHAGENGEIGIEEIKYIKPTINKLKVDGIDINGPLSADSILIKNNLKKYNCFIFISHDQGLIPFKYISQFSGVNYTGNLNIIRTSPDHGTAYDLVGKKNISNKSIINCYKLIKKIHRNRLMNEKS